MTEETGLLALWAAPRSRSTAFFRQMLARNDHLCLHEPLADICDVGHVVLPGLDGGETTLRTEEDVVAHLRRLGRERRVFVKETLEHDYHLRHDADFLRAARHAFIIRDPRATVISHLGMRPKLACIEVGYENLHRLFEAVVNATGETAPVIDADVLVQDPEGVVRAFCQRFGLPFVPEALRWEPREEPHWRRSRAWHGAASTSSCFDPRVRTPAQVDPSDPRIERLVAHHTPFYEALAEHVITPVPADRLRAVSA